MSRTSYDPDRHPLRVARKIRGWTAEELGRRAGVAQSTIARIELRNHHPSARTLAKLATALGLEELETLLEPWVEGADE